MRHGPVLLAADHKSQARHRTGSETLSDLLSQELQPFWDTHTWLMVERRLG